MNWKERAIAILKDSLYPQKSLKDMTKHEKISACYQHACLMYEDGVAINNRSVRERFELNKNESSVASRIISDTVDAVLSSQLMLKQLPRNT